MDVLLFSSVLFLYFMVLAAVIKLQQPGFWHRGPFIVGSMIIGQSIVITIVLVSFFIGFATFISSLGDVILTI